MIDSSTFGNRMESRKILLVYYLLVTFRANIPCPVFMTYFSIALVTFTDTMYDSFVLLTVVSPISTFWRREIVLFCFLVLYPVPKQGLTYSRCSK